MLTQTWCHLQGDAAVRNMVITDRQNFGRPVCVTSPERDNGDCTISTWTQ